MVRLEKLKDYITINKINLFKEVKKKLDRLSELESQTPSQIEKQQD